MKKFGKYEVLGELGHGAMGVVYRARDPMIDRPVALKTITTGLADDSALLQRFYREAQSAGGLQHPNIVTIYDMGQAGELPYIAMELVEGENLDQLIARRSALPLISKLLYAMQACRAFDFAHKRGIIHRDIKPGNVMVRKDGTVKVVDFGIARVLGTSRTQTGMLIGTFAYMSPEQYQGEHADERSDIWSFGVLLYELLSYQRPFAGSSPASLIHNICIEEPVPLRKWWPECPEELEVAVSKMLQKGPSERYQSMEDVLFDLDLITKALLPQSVADLLEQARGFFEQGNFAEACDLVRQALKLEPGNPQARALLEKANAALKRLLNRPKVEQLVEQGQALLGEGKLQEAKDAAEDALHLDSSFAPAGDLRRAIEAELERARVIPEPPPVATHAAQPPAPSPPLTPSFSKEYALVQAASATGATLSPEKTTHLDSAATQPLASWAALPTYVAPGKPGAPAPVTPPEIGEESSLQTTTAEITPAAPPQSAPAVLIEAEQSPLPAGPPVQVRRELPASPSAIPGRRMRVALGILTAGILCVAWIAWRSRSSDSQPPQPRGDALEVQQRQSMEAANARIAANDLDGALKILQQATALNGSLTPEVQEKLSEVFRLKEERLWEGAKGLVAEAHYPEAQQAFEDILALPLGGVHRADAQQYLDKSIPLFIQAEKDLARGDFRSARRAADLLQQNGSNPAALVTKIDQAEQHDLKQLENQFDQLKQSSDSGSIRQLKALQLRFRTLAGDGGPQASEDSSYADRINGAIADLRAPAGKRRGGPRCESLQERLQLGEALNEEERAYLKDKCH